MSRGVISEKELSILRIAESMPAKLPTEKQCEVLLDTLKRLHAQGCIIGEDVIPAGV